MKIRNIKKLNKVLTEPGYIVDAAEALQNQERRRRNKILTLKILLHLINIPPLGLFYCGRNKQGTPLNNWNTEKHDIEEILAIKFQVGGPVIQKINSLMSTIK